MKDVLVAFAEYNRGANKKLVETLKGAKEEALTEDQGSYYKSVIGTLEHIAGGELMWLKRFLGFLPNQAVSADKLVAGDFESVKTAMKAKPDALYETLMAADALMLKFVSETNEADLSKRFSYTTMKGDKLERSLRDMIFHILNHATHHRGEISALLDRKGISNDYSGFNNYMK